MERTGSLKVQRQVIRAGSIPTSEMRMGLRVRQYRSV